MSLGLEFVLRTVLIGIGATLVMDLWAAFLKRCFGVPALDYGSVGRWIGHFPQGRFRHDSIGKALPISGERTIGWGAHYVIGIAFAGLLLSIWGLEWGRQPTVLPALIVGLFTLVAPFFIMQSGMTLGIAASNTPKPNVSRLRSIMTHTIFGMGFYLPALIVALLLPAVHPTQP